MYIESEIAESRGYIKGCLYICVSMYICFITDTNKSNTAMTAKKMSTE